MTIHLIMILLCIGSLREAELSSDTGEDVFPFTECDYLFDSAKAAPYNEFSFFAISSALLEDSDVSSEANDYSEDSLNTDKKFKAAISVPFPNIQCIYTFVARKGERVKIEFTDLQLWGTADNCDFEYLDVYSELQYPSDDLLTASLSGRFCGSVVPHVRISLYNVLILVFHSRIGNKRPGNIRINGRYEFISEARYIPGRRMADTRECAFLIEPNQRVRGNILSPTYPGPYPSNYRCVYLLKGNLGDRIRLHFIDFDIYFGGEHCPYDSLAIYDGLTTSAPILRKVCGLQQRLEIFSFDSSLLLEFNTSSMLKNNARGFSIDYEFSNRFVNARAMMLGQRGVSHIAGTECDIRILSNRESIHYIASPNFPNAYPPNTTCTYILDGLQGDQNLEKVILTFETLSLEEDVDTLRASTNEVIPSNSSSQTDECISGSFVGVALTADSIKTVLSMTEESVYDVILCNDVPKGSTDLGPYTSLGPRIVVVFGSSDALTTSIKDNRTKNKTKGFKSLIEFKTDFGVPGEAMGDSNVCMFLFTEKRGSFNSPRYPANYPLDTNCTYIIGGSPNEEILLYFTQFALFEEDLKSKCNDYLEIYDVFEDAHGEKRYQFQAKHCWTMLPGPTISTFGAHEMRVIFTSDSFGTANGFNVRYEIRKSRKRDVPLDPDEDPRHCGQLIEAKQDVTTGYFTSPGFPIKYSRDQQCDWEVRARKDHQILLQLIKMDVEGEITEQKTSCMNAVIVMHLDYKNRSADLAICGTNRGVLSPIVTNSNSIRISFLTAPDKVNGLIGFNFTWTEIRQVQSDSECTGDSLYLCSYTRLCIDASLRCNGDDNCGENDDTDEAHCGDQSDISQTAKRSAALTEYSILTTSTILAFTLVCISVIRIGLP